MIQLHTSADKTLNILSKETNKALSKILEDISPQELATLSKSPKDLGELLSSFLKNGAGVTKQDNQALLTLLKNNPTFQELSNVTATLKDLQQLLQKEQLPFTAKLQEVLSKSLENIAHIDDKTLKSKLENSGIFLESKLKTLNLSEKEFKNILSNDLKALVHKTLQELQNSSNAYSPGLTAKLDKLTLQIDYYQLLSHLSNASAIYLPYSFEGLEEGSVSIKKANKAHYFCDIDLKLKEYGALQMRLGLFEKNQLRININCESKELREMLQENLPVLKEQLFGVGLYPQDISFLESNTIQYDTHSTDLDLGFEVKA